MGSYAGLRKPESVYFVKLLGGKDTVKKDYDIENKGDKAQNCRYNVEVGSIEKRPPVAYYNGTVDSNPIQSLYRYYRKNGNQYLIQLNGTTLRVGNDADGTFSTLATLGSSSGYRFSAVTYNDLCLISTGYDNIIQTDGTVAWELGACKAALTTATGNLDNDDYYYAVSFNTAADGSGTDTINGAVSNTVTCTATQEKVALTNIPLGDTATTLSRNIWRTEGGGSTLKKLTTITDNSTTTYADNIADGSLGATLGAVTDDIPKGALLYVTQERLFIARDPDYPNRVYYSNYYKPHYVSTSTYDVIGSDDNDKITGMAKYLGVTHIFKNNSIRPYYVSGDPSVWTLGTITSTQGCPAPYSIVGTPYGIAYQSWEYFYLFNGQSSTPLTQDFYAKEEILKSRMTEAYGIFHKETYMVCYTDAVLGHQYHDKVFIFDMIGRNVSVDVGGPSSATTRVNMNCLHSATGGTDEGQLYGGDSLLGYVYKYDTAAEVINYNTKSSFSTGTHSDTTAIAAENSPRLTRETPDDMYYETNAEAQDAWGTSTTTASEMIPPDLGTGLDGSSTISEDTDLGSGTWNYTDLTIDAGFTLTAAGGIIKCLGTVTINGTLEATNTLAIYAQTITIGAAGVITGDVSLRCNTLNNSGSISQNMCEAANGGALYGDAMESNRDGSYGGVQKYEVTGGWEGSITFPSSDALSAVYWLGGDGDGGSRSVGIELKVAGEWTSIYSDSKTSTSGDIGQQGSLTPATDSTGWEDVTGIKWTMTNDPGGATSAVYMGEVEVHAYIKCDYLNSSGSVPTSGDTDDFVNLLDVYSEGSNVNEGDYSLKVICPPGASTLDAYIERTINSTDLSDATHDYILVDVYASRTGTNFQFGMGEAAYDETLKDITITTANTWETKVLDFSAVTDASKDAITKLGFKFTNTDDANVVYIDNIRVGVGTGTWTSAVLEINAWKYGNMYWNEALASGDVLVYTRNADTAANCALATWSTALTLPAGSQIISTSASADPDDMQFFQFKVTFVGQMMVAGTDSNDYTCFLAHTAAAGNKPITGAGYAATWLASGTTSLGNTWVDATAYDPTDSFPYQYSLSNSMIRFEYYKITTLAETEVEFLYRTGYRNFDQPLVDKTYKKIISVHKKYVTPGVAPEPGMFTFSYDIDNETGTAHEWLDLSLTTYPYRWESFFPDTAFGRTIRFQWYKNDLYDFTLKQLAAVIEVEPII